MSKNIKFINISQSDRKDKRFSAKFNIDGKERLVHFGSEEMNTYIDHGDEERKKRYQARHKNDNLDDPTSPGSLSWNLLWGDSTNLKKNIESYKKKFKI